MRKSAKKSENIQILNSLLRTGHNIRFILRNLNRKFFCLKIDLINIIIFVMGSGIYISLIFFYILFTARDNLAIFFNIEYLHDFHMWKDFLYVLDELFEIYFV